MTNRIAQYLSPGFVSLKPVRQLAFEEGLIPTRRDMRDRRRTSAPHWYADGYADGARRTEERFGRAAWYAFIGGLLGGILCGVVWRELGALFAGVLSRM
jgi:hypothetical protein